MLIRRNVYQSSEHSTWLILKLALLIFNSDEYRGKIGFRLVACLRCLWIITAFCLFADIGICIWSSVHCSASVLMNLREKHVRWPQFDAAYGSELRLREKHFWRDIRHSYFGVGGADWVGSLYHRSWVHIT